MEYDKKDVGRRIKKIRRDLGFTLEQFGSLIDNSSKSNVSKWESGVSIPNNKRLKLISTLGKISVDELLYGTRNEIIRMAINDSLIEYLDFDDTEEKKKDYEENKERYDKLITGLFEKYTNYGEHILPFDNLYFHVRRMTSKELEAEYIKGARTNRSSLLYLKEVLEQTHIKISEYEHDPLTQEAINNNEISDDVFKFVIKSLIDIKMKLNDELNSK